MNKKYLAGPSEYLLTSGLLFEINRTLLHPLGLAIEVEYEKGESQTSTYALFRIIDDTDDETGMWFDPKTVASSYASFSATMAKAAHRIQKRIEKLGFVTQGNKVRQRFWNSKHLPPIGSKLWGWTRDQSGCWRSVQSRYYIYGSKHTCFSVTDGYGCRYDLETFGEAKLIAEALTRYHERKVKNGQKKEGAQAVGSSQNEGSSNT